MIESLSTYSSWKGYAKWITQWHPKNRHDLFVRGTSDYSAAYLAVRRKVDMITKHRLQGVAGLVGAGLFFVGDMLFNGHFGSGANFAAETHATVRMASANRLFVGGLVGPPAACLSLVGFLHVARNVRQGSQRFAGTILGLAVVFWVSVGATHLLWTPRALAVKFCANGEAGCVALQQAIRSCWTYALDMSAIPGFVLGLLLFALVISGNTRYPRWTAFVNPAIWIVLIQFLPTAPAPFGAILVGGSYNLPWVLFFMVSLLTTFSAIRATEFEGQTALRSAKVFDGVNVR